MSRKVLVLEEVLAMLKVTGAPNRVIDKFREHAEFVFGKKPLQEVDDIQIASGFGKHAHVELTLNDQRTQMDVKKAREIGLMLIEAAEAATSDEMFMALLTRIGIPADDLERRGQILLDLREIRQGTRGVVRPT